MWLLFLNVLVQDLQDVIQKLLPRDVKTAPHKKGNSWQKRKEENERLWAAHSREGHTSYGFTLVLMLRLCRRDGKIVPVQKVDMVPVQVI